MRQRLIGSLLFPQSTLILLGNPNRVNERTSR